MPEHGLVTGVVAVASCGGHLLAGFDQRDTNVLWSITLDPLRIRKGNVNDNGERRECNVKVKEVEDGHVIGGSGRCTIINWARAVVQILSQNLHLVNVDNKVLRAQLEALDIPQADLIKLGAPEAGVLNPFPASVPHMALRIGACS